MFCMKCGQKLPDEARFCMVCGTPLGAVSPSASTNSETINLDGTHTFVPAMCPNCNAHMNIDSSSKMARCDTCGTECLVQDAIKTLSVKGNVQVGNAVINVSSTSNDALLDKIEIMIANGDFDIYRYCNTVLDTDPVNERVFLYQLLASNQCKSIDEVVQNYREIRDNIIKSKAYKMLMKYGNESVKNKFQELDNAYLKDLELRYKLNKENAKVGNIVHFGKIYDGIKKGEPYRWEILRVQKDRVLVCADLHGEPYHQGAENATWKDCTSRKWLNSVFINSLFSKEEKLKILETVLDNDNLSGKYSPDEQTIDKVFIPSESEAQSLRLKNKGSTVFRGPVRDGYVVVQDYGKHFTYHTYDNETCFYYALMWLKLDD